MNKTRRDLEEEEKRIKKCYRGERGTHLSSPYAMVERRVVGPKCEMFLLYLLSLFNARPMDISSPTTKVFQWLL